MLLYGKTPGTTTLTLWDQKRVQRAVITITVISREDQQAEKDLTELVADFPSVKVRRVKGKLVLTGVVQTKNDLEAIEKIAETAEATSLVRLSGMVQPTSPGGTSTPAGPTDAPKYNENGDPLPPPATIHYEFDVLEASVNYSSGSYATGVEPAGRSLFKKAVAAGTGGNVEALRPGLRDSAARQGNHQTEEGRRCSHRRSVSSSRCSRPSWRRMGRSRRSY